jgi:high-affinity Fe2+/Pb2+ permease
MFNSHFSAQTIGFGAWSGAAVSIVCAAALFPLLMLLVANRDIPIIRFTLTLVFGFCFLFGIYALSGGDSPRLVENDAVTGSVTPGLVGGWL